MKNFDVFAAIDWSGAQNPVKTRAIALAIANAGSKAPHVMGHVWSRTTIADWIIDQANLDHRMLIGIDCNFSYSRQVTDRQFETPYQARDLWHLVDRVSQSEANYYAGPYWSDKRYKDLFWLSGTKEPGHELPLRETEKACYQAGLGRPESPNRKSVV